MKWNSGQDICSLCYGRYSYVEWHKSIHISSYSLAMVHLLHIRIYGLSLYGRRTVNSSNLMWILYYYNFVYWLQTSKRKWIIIFSHFYVILKFLILKWWVVCSAERSLVNSRKHSIWVSTLTSLFSLITRSKDS